MKKYKILIVLVVILAVVGISLAFNGNYFQGLIFKTNSRVNNGDISKLSPDIKLKYKKSKNIPKFDDCNQSQFKATSILIVDSINNVPQGTIDQANFYKNQTSIAFSEATGKLGLMDTSAPLFIMNASDAIPANSGSTLISSADAVNYFYKTNPDDYDFIILFIAPDYPNVPSQYTAFKRNISGIGYPVLDYPDFVSSGGKLRGVVQLYNSVGWNEKGNLASSVNNVILHEIAHNWAVGVGDIFTGDGTGELEIKSYEDHYYAGLDSPNDSGDPLGGGKFVSNGDDTFKNVGSDFTGLKKYHPFTLYFMGLLPKSEYGTQYQIYMKKPGSLIFDDAIPYKKISVNDIIAVEGKRKCK